MAHYKKLANDTMAEPTNRILYERLLAAGLPVIDNLQKLVFSGGRVREFEGYFYAGSLSLFLASLTRV